MPLFTSERAENARFYLVQENSMHFIVLFTALLSFGANAGSSIEYGTQEKEIKLCGVMKADDAFRDSFAMAVPKYLVTVTTVRTPVYTCESTGGDGKGDWKGFYDRSGNKADQLDAAIKGVGPRIAPYLVEIFMRDKPRSWQAFVERIEEGAEIAAREGGISKDSWVPHVLYRYKQENMESLGYFDRSECRVTGYDERTYTDREQIEVVSTLVEAYVAGGMLLPNECESLSVVFKGDRVETRTDSSLNKYRSRVDHRASRVNVRFEGTRNAVRALQLVDGKLSLVKLSGNVVNATIAHPAVLLNASHPAYATCKAEVAVEIQGKKRGVWGSKRVTVASRKFPLEMNADATDISVTGVQLEPKMDLAVQVTTSYLPGCPFFSTEASKKSDLRTADLR
jgi:hypothetical protein